MPLVALGVAFVALAMSGGIWLAVSGGFTGRVVQGERLADDDRRALVNAGIVHTNDVIKFVYAPGYESVVEHGCVLTETSLVTYRLTSGHTIDAKVLDLDEVVALDKVSSGSRIANRVYRAVSRDHRASVTFELPRYDKLADRFVHELERVTTERAPAHNERGEMVATGE